MELNYILVKLKAIEKKEIFNQIINYTCKYNTLSILKPFGFHYFNLSIIIYFNQYCNLIHRINSTKLIVMLQE